MNAHISISDALSSLLVSNRNPTWSEYEKAAPADKRAILERWHEIIATPCADFDDLIETAKAMGRRGRAMDKPIPVRFPVDDLQRDYDCDIDVRQNWEHGA